MLIITDMLHMGQIRDIKEKSFRELFRDSFYVIPVYQRVYSWDEYSLNALWDDITSVRDAITKKKSEVDNHFMSSILVKEIQEGSSIKHHVVDGQQRMTTMFLLFHAALDTLDEHKESLETGFYKMVQKSLTEVLYGEHYEEDEETEKVREVRIPRLFLQNQDDSHPLQVLVTTGAATWTKLHNSSKTVKAYYFFKKELEAAFQESPRRFKNTVEVALDKLHLIYIPILESEAPQKIFESVNGLTKKLYAGELVKNYLLLSISNESQSYDLYRDYWAEFDKEEWTKDEKAKGRLTEFIYWWVTSKGIKTKSDDESVYRDFKTACSLSSYSKKEIPVRVREISADFHRTVLSLIQLEEKKYNPSSRLEVSYSRLYTMNNRVTSKSVFIQFLRIINVLENHYGKLDRTQLDKLLLPLESYIIRKSLCEKYAWTTTEYLILTAEKVFVHPSVTEYKTVNDYLTAKVKQFCEDLAEAKDIGRRFDSTEFLLDYITGNNNKGTLPKEFDDKNHTTVRMLMIQVENYLRTNSFTPNGASIAGEFSLEHWLPQSSDSRGWPLINEPSREVYTKSIGNLCIIPQSMNSHLSNDSLEEKLEKVFDILAKEGNEKTGLHTFDKVTDLCFSDDDGIIWDEKKIDSRAKWLMDIILNKVFKDIDFFTGKKRAKIEEKVKQKTIWDNPVEGQRIVATSKGTIVRGYQTVEGVLTIDEVTGINPIANPSFRNYHQEKRQKLLAESTQQADGTYNWKGSLVCPNRTGWLAIFMGTPMSDVWKIE